MISEHFTCLIQLPPVKDKISQTVKQAKITDNLLMPKSASRSLSTFVIWYFLQCYYILLSCMLPEKRLSKKKLYWGVAQASGRSASKANL